MPVYIFLTFKFFGGVSGRVSKTFLKNMKGGGGRTHIISKKNRLKFAAKQQTKFCPQTFLDKNGVFEVKMPLLGIFPQISFAKGRLPGWFGVTF